MKPLARLAFAATGTLLVAGCAGTPTPEQLGAACAGLAGRTVPASAIGLTSGAAAVKAAALVKAVPGAGSRP